MLTDKMIKQQTRASLIMDKAMRKAHDEGLVTRQIHDSISCSIEHAKRLEQIMEEVTNDFKRT